LEIKIKKMNYTYYGQSCFLLEADGKKYLFDPFITPNPLAAAIDTKAIQADYILVSHGHGDHVADLALLAKQTGALVIATPEVAEWAGKQGVTNIHAMNFGVAKFDFGKLRMVWATHSSAMPDGSNGGNPAGFVLETGGKTVYFAGDTSLNADMKLLADLYKLDYAILPIGGNYTMDVDDALIATKYIGCDHVIGVHYNTFPVIEIDTEEAVAKFERENKKLYLPAIGETITL
jgi:L-ascorbate metabolism protein UlaG (beta-lactamase superfamily)